MAQPAELTRKRAQRVLRRLIEPARRPLTAAVEIAAYHVGGEPVTWSEASRAAFDPFEVGGAWGPAWDTSWFRVRGAVPDDWAGRDVALSVHLGYGGATGFGAEGLVWSAEGEPLQGISPNHREVPIGAAGGDSFELYIEAASNPLIDPFADPAPLYMPDPTGRPLLRLTTCQLVVVDPGVDALWHDWTLLSELYDALSPDEPRAARILRALDEAANKLDPRNVSGTAAAAREVLRPQLAKRANASAHRYAAVGNAHIDTAWLWPLRETERKCARTFSTVLSLLERHPEYRFAASQPQQFAWMKQRYPQLFERLRKAVADGRFDVVGSMWVEADCNVPSGESLIRQIVHGKRFYETEFGVETQSLWLPDVFGYAAALPQILSQAGIRWFLTQKLSWNQVNRFPHHTFWWEGIDGTRVFTHFPPADTYNGDFSVPQLLHGVRNFSEKAICDSSIYLYGWGDGGGGPTVEMLERAKRAADLEGLPKLELMGGEEALATLEAESADASLPVWVGELYLEMHRGTYTTHAEVKRANRKLELALRDAELWSVAAEQTAGTPYPAADIDEAWKLLLLHQFHDIIPGSSIHWVYEDTARDHASIAAVTERLVRESLSAIGGGEGDWARVLVANPLSAPRREVVDIGGAPAFVEAPACGWRVQEPRRSAAEVAEVTTGDDWMDNGILRVVWDEDGLLASLVHAPTGREAVADGCRANLLQVHDDRPNVYDAWDIDAVAYDTRRDLPSADLVEFVERTPLRASVRIVRRIGASTIDQVMRLAAGSGRLEFHTVVDWQESHTLLKAAFPLAVHTHKASFEIQFGHVERPTHRNTSWDEARFEVCAHTWADLSEQGFGVALLNDCKYGHDVVGNVLRLTLLRSSTHPDPVADKGRHEFAYALFPHAGDLATGGVVAEAHAFNSPLRVVPAGGARSANVSLVEVDDPGVVVTAVKRADDGDGVVVRCYEAFGGRRQAQLSYRGASSVERTDLLERPASEQVESDGATALLDLRPFEICTLRFRGA